MHMVHAQLTLQVEAEQASVTGLAARLDEALQRAEAAEAQVWLGARGGGGAAAQRHN